MQSYLDIVRMILDRGMSKQPVRYDSHIGSSDKPAMVDSGTIGMPCIFFQHNMADGFPLLTTKKVPFFVVSAELEMFIKGIHSKQWLKDRKCHIWDQWCPPDMIPDNIKNDRIATEKFMLEQDELGPIYGVQWSNFNGTGYNQIATIADRLRQNPYDRRMVCSAWVPSEIHKMALPPCHFAWNVSVYGNTINLAWIQRSADLMLGVPFNIASYALLLCLLAKHADLTPGILSGTLVDCHIYDYQIDNAKKQLLRSPGKLPTLRLPDRTSKNVKWIKSDSTEVNDFDIFNWTYDQVALEGYNPQESIKYDKVVIT